MATNKHAIIRYQALDRCFSNPGKRYFIDDLIAACSKALYDFTGTEKSISKRQVQEDIKYMESEQGYRIPLERHKEGKKVYYRYTDKNFSINSQPLNEHEELQIKEALLTLSRFKGVPQFEWVNEIMAKLDTQFNFNQLSQPIIEFEQNQYLKGTEHISVLYNAILYKRALNIQYRSFKKPDEANEIVIHPYFLKQYNNRWFLFGLNAEYQSIQNLSLDRIEMITELSIPYSENTYTDFEEYFEDIIGVTVEDVEIQTIELKLSEQITPYILTKPLHGSQKYNKQTGCITIEVRPNYELISLILSYRDRIEVISPPDFRANVLEIIEAMRNNYLCR